MGLLVVSPHFDDAVLSAWGLLEEPGVRVANVFTAIPPDQAPTYWEKLTRARGTVEERIVERTLEDRDALALAGIVPVNLGFLECLYGGGPNIPRDRIVDALAPLVSAADRAVFPAAIGGHPDHSVVRDVGKHFLAAGADVRFYADCPYSIKYGWPSWVTGAAPSPFLDEDVYLEEQLRNGGLSLTRLGAAVTKLRGALLQRKLAATAAYRTQVDALDSGPLRRVSNPDVVCFEVVWTPG
jgi:LmbE family N-acetylglucosaminyl deacetylase